MADENLPDSDDAVVPTSEAAPAPVTAEAEPTRAGGSWSGALLGLALLAVLLTLAGIFGQMQKVPNHLPLGLGLLLWGVLDLLAQRRGLVVWKGAKAVVGNAVNLLRGLAVLGVGVWLCLMAAGVIKPANTAVVTVAGVSLLAIYLGIALGLEVAVKGTRLSAQAFLLVSLALMFVSYLYFSLPFTYAWAAVFACLSFTAAAWAVHAGVLDETPSLSRAVLLAVLALGSPLGTYTVQQMFFTEEQMLFTPTLLIPRMREVVGGLGADAAQITWAPVHTQKGQPGDVPFSDKVAFTDWRDDKPGVGLFLQKDDGPGQLAWVETGEEPTLTAFSLDGSRLAFTQKRNGAKAPSLAVLEPAAEKPPTPSVKATQEPPQEDPKEDPKDKHAREAKEKEEAARLDSPYVVRTLYSASVAPGPDHGQVWRDLSKELYFAGAQDGLRKGNSAVMRADLQLKEVQRLREGRGLPAISPDGSALLSVGFEPNVRYLEMADGLKGERSPRVFKALAEKHYFPAWNAAQKKVLFIKQDIIYIMNANGTDQHLFDPEDLDSKVWYTDKTVPFTLQWKESGDTYKIYRSKPDGSRETLILDVKARDISAPQWSADGKRVALIVHGVDESMVLTVGWDGSWARRFFITKDALSALKWSPDGLRLAWICHRDGEGTQELWTAGFEGLDPVLAYESHGVLGGLSWSPASKHVAVQETTVWHFLGLRVIKPELNNVIMVDLTDKHARVMTRYGLMSREPAFSPQGVAIAYFTDQRPWHPGFMRERTSALVISQLY